MRTYLISYDLANPQDNRNAMTTAIMVLGQTWARPLDQTWYIKSELNETDIESVLLELLRDDDGLIVQEVQGKAIVANTALRWFKRRPLLQDIVETNVVAFPAPAEPREAAIVEPMAAAG